MNRVPDKGPRTIREINDLKPPEKRAIYHTLLPDWVFSMFGIDPTDYTVQGQPVIHVRCPTGSSAVELSVYDAPRSSDPVLYLHMGDTFNSQLAVLLVVVNDPESARFNIDVDTEGNPTQLGTKTRNIPEEIRAMQAGLAPGQIRRGLRIFRTAVPVFRKFVRSLEYRMFFVEPLFYHNAIMFERYGFMYSRGLKEMRDIHQAFQPGGELYARLTAENPFRQPNAWQTVLGRSWAIHDDILNRSFASMGIQMYLHTDKQGAVQTFPGGGW
ncbi:MAG: hypothetical protein JXJ20_05960 [Anaerolineae bacterium]|nr:hypothetical protein [Anaerolineae bacterium]